MFIKWKVGGMEWPYPYFVMSLYTILNGYNPVSAHPRIDIVSIFHDVFFSVQVSSVWPALALDSSPESPLEPEMDATRGVITSRIISNSTSQKE